MTMFASWVHGNALTVESPGRLERVGYYGWGADLLIRPGQACWFHVPLPTPVIVSDVRTRLLRVFLLFKSDPGAGEIRSVHVYDGSAKPKEFDNLHLSGEHRTGLDGSNVFELTPNHTVRWGVGISFLFQAATGIDSPIPSARLIVASAGADYAA